MNASNIAEWMRKEHLQVNILMRNLRRQLVEPDVDRAGWLSALRESFDHLRAHLIKHISMKEDGGYMAAVLEHRPTLSAEVQRLERQHEQFVHLMDAIHHELHATAPEDGLILHDACRRIENFLSYIERHEEAENLLVTSVFTRDVGGKD